MNSFAFRALRVTSLTAILFVLPLFSSAKEPATPAPDPATVVLARGGAIPVKIARRDGFDNAIEVGNRKESVGFYLGQPSAILRDGTWLYREFTVDQSAATGTLVVSFHYSHVSKLTLISPAAEMALLDANQKPGSKPTVVASNAGR